MIRLLVADDHPIVREGLKRIVAEYADMQVTRMLGDYDGQPFAETGEGRDVIIIAEPNRPA